MVGDRLIPLAERYRLLSVVGQGGMGTVWRAHDEMLDRDVAVKEVRLPERLTAGERRLLCRRLIEEARATAALRHPGVIDVHDVVIEDGRPWIVMEFLRARSLHEEIAEHGPLPVERAARIGQSVLAVLNAAHQAGILHRDVKPSNVLLCDDGRILLTDFGLAVHVDSGPEPEETLVAGIEGSPAYLPPERVRGEPGVRASDLWSLGATLYAAVEGTSPFLRCHALASMVAVLLGEYPPPVRAGRLAPVIEGLLRQDPCHRLHATEAARLLGAATEPPPPSWRRLLPNGWPGRAVPGDRRRARGDRRSRLGTMVFAISVAVTAVVLGAWSARWNSVGKGEALTLLPVPGGAFRTASYHESAGYHVDVPLNWRREVRGGGVHWRDPVAGRGLRITPVSGVPLAGLRAVERETADSKGHPGYRLLRLEPVPELNRPAAEWEYTWGEGEHRMHALRTRTAGYEFYFYAPDARWTPAQRVYERILGSFRTG
ncbi:serine/threonine-protein kinase [Actinomadura viridis]|uniref:serine/threonine-protein kinase n=1 Tax=Actinomadura viridis TaxID=58110 RepID=UPI0036907106